MSEISRLDPLGKLNSVAHKALTRVTVAARSGDREHNFA